MTHSSLKFPCSEHFYRLTFFYQFYLAQYWVATCFDFLDSSSLFYYFSYYIIRVGGRWIEAKSSLISLVIISLVLLFLVIISLLLNPIIYWWEYEIEEACLGSMIIPTKYDNSSNPSSRFCSDCRAAMPINTSIKSACFLIFFELGLQILIYCYYHHNTTYNYAALQECKN